MAKKAASRPRVRPLSSALKAWAVVSNNQLVTGQNVSNISHVAPGTYKLWFKQPMKGNYYAIIATAAPKGVVNYNDISADSFVLTVSDVNGSPLDADLSAAAYEA